jgi:signal peptidase II
MTPADDRASDESEADAATDSGTDTVTGAVDDPIVGSERESSAPEGRSRSSIALSLGIAAVVLLVDQITKDWALGALADGRSRHVFWTLHWNLTFNSGMAFSRAQGIGPYIGALALVVVVGFVLSLRRSKGVGSSVAVGLVIGGAAGNLADRLFREDGWLRGRVVDFIDFEWWPIFNVADIGVTVGGVLILLAAMFESKPSRR